MINNRIPFDEHKKMLGLSTDEELEDYSYDLGFGIIDRITEGKLEITALELFTLLRTIQMKSQSIKNLKDAISTYLYLPFPQKEELREAIMRGDLE